MRRWRSLNQLRDDFKASGIELKPSPAPKGTKGCHGKVRHPTRAAAEAALEDLKAGTRDHPRRTSRLVIYRCRWCRAWHKGHSAPTTRRLH